MTPQPRSDHDELLQLGPRYARAADDRDVDALAALFHPDATIEGSRGMQTLAEWLDSMRAPRAYPASMHVLSVPLVELDGDDATLDTYAVVHQLGDPAQKQADLTLGVRYVDTAVRHDGRWVIRRRIARTLWMR